MSLEGEIVSSSKFTSKWTQSFTCKVKIDSTLSVCKSFRFSVILNSQRLRLHCDGGTGVVQGVAH